MNFKKSLCLLLACLTVCPLFAACGDNGDTPVVTKSSDDVTVTTEQEELPEVMNAAYGADFNILSAGNVAYNDFDFAEESSLALDNAQYKRKLKVEEDYGVKISETIKKSYSSGGGPGYLAVSQQCNSGDTTYDLCLVAGYDVSVLAYSGYLYDLNSIPKMDLTKSWWDQEANRTLNVKGVMFFSTGDITVSDNQATFCLIYNKQLAKNYSLESPYQLVYDGKWTFENFGTLCKTVTEDLNQDGAMNQNDRFGLLVWDDSACGIISAAGERCCTINDDGKIELTLYNENTISALEQYFGIAFDKQYALTYQRVISGGTTMWTNDQALFWTTTISSIPGLREMESDFGILPYPKLNETQTNHYSLVAPYNSQFICVPLIQADIERTGVIAEALAYYGQKIVTPAYYDVNLVGQNTRDEESEGMLDIIFDHLVFDIGYIYQVAEYNKQLIYMVREYNTNFTSMYDTYKSKAENLLSVINEYYGQAVAEWQ